MDPLYRCRPCLLSHSIHHHHHHHHHHPYHPHHPHHHHHHHQHTLLLCSCHHHHLHHHFLSQPHTCPRFGCPPPNPELVGPVPLPDNLNMEVSVYKETHDSTTQILQELEHEDKEDEEDEEPVFVLTDEWMEFFAKSEAKRKLAKKQAKKKGKA